MSRVDYTGEDYYGPENGLVCWDCIPKLPRKGNADNIAYAHVIWKFFHENFPGSRISQEGRIPVQDVDSILKVDFLGDPTKWPSNEIAIPTKLAWLN